MKNIVLTSSFHNVAKELATEGLLPSESTKVGFVITAAEPYSNKPWVEADRRALRDLGYQVTDVDLKNRNSDELRKIFSDAQIVFVAGGNTTYLAEHSRASGFETVVRDVLSRGGLYIGSSAGSILAGPSVEPFLEEDLRELPTGYEPQNPECLKLVDYIILPHQPQAEDYSAKAEKAGGGKYEFVKLTDREYRLGNI